MRRLIPIIGTILGALWAFIRELTKDSLFDGIRNAASAGGSMSTVTSWMLEHPWTVTVIVPLLLLVIFWVIAFTVWAKLEVYFPIALRVLPAPKPSRYVASPKGFLNWEVEGPKAMERIGKLLVVMSKEMVRWSSKIQSYTGQFSQSQSSRYSLRIANKVAQETDSYTDRLEARIREYQNEHELLSESLTGLLEGHWGEALPLEQLQTFQGSIERLAGGSVSGKAGIVALRESIHNNRYLHKHGISQDFNGATDRLLISLDRWLVIQDDLSTLCSQWMTLIEEAVKRRALDTPDSHLSVVS